MTPIVCYPEGSIWRRWEPHIHTPGTVLNDQYGQEEASWHEFLQRIEVAVPKIEVLGITDYYSLDKYQNVLERQKKGRLNDVALIFPNVEMRLAIGTGKGAPINIHLLVAPDDPEHVIQTERFLRNFTFNAFEDTFRCERADLVRLGKAYSKHKGELIQDDMAALRAGCNQFKVNFDELRTAWQQNAWIQNNCLVAVAGSNRDGTAGLGGDASLDTMRAEIEKFAHIIFASQPKQRAFWLGEGAVSRQELDSRWGGCKPCLHGSDAHQLTRVGSPDLDRICWLKGDPIFESLRQACIEPAGRAYIDAAAPTGVSPSRAISKVEIEHAKWLKTPDLALNPGLVCIIGARGSGKTALADLIAAGALSISPHINDRSFIKRASKHLKTTSVVLHWQDKQLTRNSLADIDIESFVDEPRVQYLSQQFVDKLCSADGLTKELLAEIERVIYQAHSPENRLGTTNFQGLLELRATRVRVARKRYEEELESLSKEIIAEVERKDDLPNLTRQCENLKSAIERQKSDRGGLAPIGNSQRAAHLDAVVQAVEAASRRLEAVQRQRQALLSLRDDVANFRQTTASRYFAQLTSKYSDAALSDEVWQKFKIDFVGDVDSALKQEISRVETTIGRLRGESPATSMPLSETSVIPLGAALDEQTLATLQLELERLQALVGIDQDNIRKYKSISQAIARDETTLNKLQEQISLAGKSSDKIKELRKKRSEIYQAVFKAMIDEEHELGELYAPLKERLKGEHGALGKLTFQVRRSANVAVWAQTGEELLDLRKNGPFKGRGTLLQQAQVSLQPVWECGSPQEIATAMLNFLSEHEQNLRMHAPFERQQADEYRKWTGQIARWLYSTDHIRIAYGVQYDGVDIEQLSPGTRGIVLLLLYLAVDREDMRPLIIDQPEENLDPKSIFDELVGRFKDVKSRRQIMIVTHNANLVVNTDADQVIVASCGPHQPGALPEITYQSGSLENPEMREKVCEILEGGEKAFKDRARRLRVRMPADPHL